MVHAARVNMLKPGIANSSSDHASHIFSHTSQHSYMYKLVTTKTYTVLSWRTPHVSLFATRRNLIQYKNSSVCPWCYHGVSYHSSSADPHWWPMKCFAWVKALDTSTNRIFFWSQEVHCFTLFTCTLRSADVTQYHPLLALPNELYGKLMRSHWHSTP